MFNINKLFSLLICLLCTLPMLARRVTTTTPLPIHTVSLEPSENLWTEEYTWKGEEILQGFYAPWSKKTDDTKFACFISPQYFYFRFWVSDTSLCLNDNYKTKKDVAPEDRAEIFFAPDKDLARPYYCAEIDALGRNMDYSVQYANKSFHYEWAFNSMQIHHEKDANGYKITGRVLCAELKKLGINLRHFYLGVHRADFSTDGKVIWYTLLQTNLPRANFHQPATFFPCTSQYNK